MDVALSSFISLYNFNTGRMIFALLQIADAIDQHGDDLSDIKDHVNKAVKHARNTRGLEHRFEVSRNQPRSNPKVLQIDVKLDRAIVGLRNALQAHADSGDPEEAMSAAATKMLAACFPRGVQAITQATHVEQLSLVDALLSEIKAKHTDAVKELGLGSFTQRIGKLNEQYREAQRQTPADVVDFSEVRAARQRGQELLLEVVVMIAGRFPLGTSAHVGARQALLGPVFRQHEAIRSYLRLRRSVPDVNPETGEDEAPGAGEPASGPVTVPAGAEDLQPVLE